MYQAMENLNTCYNAYVQEEFSPKKCSSDKRSMVASLLFALFCMALSIQVWTFFSPCTLSWWHHQFLWFQMSSIRWWFSTTCCSCTLNFSDVMNCIPNHSDGYLYLISDLLCPKLEYIISSPHPHCYYPFLCHSSTCHMDVIISYLEHRFHLCPPLPQAFMAEKVIFQNVNQVILFTCFFFNDLTNVKSIWDKRPPTTSVMTHFIL